jgi:hypothetical protein
MRTDQQRERASASPPSGVAPSGVQLADLDTDGVAGRAAGRLGATPQPGSMGRLIPGAEAGQDLRALLPDGLK